MRDFVSFELFGFLFGVKGKFWCIFWGMLEGFEERISGFVIGDALVIVR